MSKSTGETYEDNLKLYEKLVAGHPHAERKGATVPYTALNGNMYSYLGKTGEMALRLPTKEREAFLKKYKTSLCKQYGIVQKEYVSVPDALLRKTVELGKFFAISYDYVAGLKPKPTKKKR